jgi:hypothetical protein
LAEQEMSTHPDTMSEHAEIETGSNAVLKAPGDPSGESGLGATPCFRCSDLEESLEQIRQLVTTDHETKSAFIRRVQACLPVDPFTENA